MDIEFVAVGTYAAANNASVTPGLPAGLADNDILILITSLREDGGSANTPSGWTLGMGGTVTPANTVECYIKVFWRKWVTGVTAPTVTFTGGGTGDTTQARIYAFRNVDVDNSPFVAMQAPALSGANAQINYDWTVSAMKLGAMFIGIRAGTNDDTLGGTFDVVVRPNDDATYWDYGHNTTTSGNDACLTLQFGLCGFEYDAANAPTVFYRSRLGTLATIGLWCSFYLKPIRTPLDYGYVGDGGAKIGSTSYTRRKRSINIYSGTGGAKVGANASVVWHQAIKRYTGSGGAKVGSLSTAGVVGPRRFYIDYANGSNSNNGKSWVYPLKTFSAIKDVLGVTLGPGDTVRIAKTPDAVSTGSSYTVIFSNSHQWAQFPDTNGLALPAGLASNLEVIGNVGLYSTWVATASSVYGPTTLDWANSGLTQIIMATYQSGQVAAYSALASTMNLSALSRLEVLMNLRDTYGPLATGAHFNIRLHLCSDAVGQTPLLTIPITQGSIDSGVFAYEGALPNGVNSISISWPLSSCNNGEVLLSSMIACKAYSDSNYVGLLTLYRLGSHESCMYVPPTRYRNVAGTKYVDIKLRNTGPQSLHNTSQLLYYRKAVSGVFSGDIASDNGGLLSRITAYWTPLLEDAYFLNDIAKGGALFNLREVKGTVGSPVRIIAGYNPATGAVDGTTSCVVRGPLYFAIPCLPAIQLWNTEYVEMSNLDIATKFVGGWGYAGASHHLTFTDVSVFSQLDNAGTIIPSGATFAPMEGATGLLHDVDIVRGKGMVYPTTHNSRQTYASPYSNAIPASRVYDIALEDCVLQSYSTTPGTDLPTAVITLRGSLSVYPVVCGSNDTPTTSFALPPIRSGSSGTLRVYGGGWGTIKPGPRHDELGGTYVFPKMALENTVLYLGTIDTEGVSSITGVYGDVEFTKIPEASFAFTSAAWNLQSDTYSWPCLLWVADHSPPVRVQKMTLSGSRVAAFAGGATPTRLLRAVMGTCSVEIDDITLPSGAASSTWCLALAETKPNLNFFGMNSGTCLWIFDTLDASNLQGQGSNGLLYPDSLLYDSGQVIAIDVRNVSWKNIKSGSWYWAGQLPSLVRFVNCNLWHSAGGSTFTTSHLVTNRIGTLASDTGFSGTAGIVLVDTQATIDATIDDPFYASNTDEFATYTSFTSRFPVSVIDTTAGTSIVRRKTSKLSKDYSIFDVGPFSWKSILHLAHRSMYTNLCALGSFNVQKGRVVTISMRVRRLVATDNYIGLLVAHNGVAGRTTNRDLFEKYAFATGIAGQWETVTVQFAAVVAGPIDVYVSHCGAPEATAWYDTFMVQEQ